MGGVYPAGAIGTGGKINFFLTGFAGVFAVEFVRENLDLGPAMLAFAEKRF